MEAESTFIETGVDKLVKLVKETGKIALSDAAKELGVSQTVVQEWVDFLEEEGIISVEYKLTKPYLVERKLSKPEVEAKAKEFASKKDVFVRKAEVSLSFLERQAQELKKVKEEFDKLKNELGFELDTVRDDLKQLEHYQKLREDFKKQLEEQKSESKSKIEEMLQHILREQKRYEELTSDLTKRKDELAKEKAEAQSMEESELLLHKKLMQLKETINLIEKRATEEDSAIKNSESHIERLNNLVEDVKQHVEEEKAVIAPLLEKSKVQERKVLELQNQIVEKIAKNQKDFENIKNITRKVNEFFEKKLAIIELVDKVNRDRNDLEKSLLQLMKKAKSFQLTAKSGDVGRELLDLEKKFSEVDAKKNMFLEELKKFTSFFKV